MIYGNNRLEILKYDVKIKSMREALGELLQSSDQTIAIGYRERCVASTTFDLFAMQQMFEYFVSFIRPV